MASIESLERRVEADPDNQDAWMALLTTQARIDGPSAYLRALETRETWLRSCDELQFYAAKEVYRRISEQFSFEGCFIRRGPGDETAFNIYTFRQKIQKTHMSLVPGGYVARYYHLGRAMKYSPQVKVNPFLISENIEHCTGRDGFPISMRVGLSANIANRVALGHRCRLPTFFEWIHAARGGNRNWDDILYCKEVDDYVIHRGNFSFNTPRITVEPVEELTVGDYAWLQPDGRVSNSGSYEGTLIGSVVGPNEVLIIPHYNTALLYKELIKAKRWNSFGLISMIGGYPEWILDSEHGKTAIIGGGIDSPIHSRLGFFKKDEPSTFYGLASFREVCSIPGCN